MKLRPQRIIKDGAMLVGKKYRGQFEKCVYELIDDVLGEGKGHKAIYVSHTVTDKKLLDSALDRVREKGGLADITVLIAGSAVSCHCGPNNFGLFVI